MRRDLTNKLVNPHADGRDSRALSERFAPGVLMLHVISQTTPTREHPDSSCGGTLLVPSRLVQRKRQPSGLISSGAVERLACTKGMKGNNSNVGFQTLAGKATAMY